MELVECKDRWYCGHSPCTHRNTPHVRDATCKEFCEFSPSGTICTPVKSSKSKKGSFLLLLWLGVGIMLGFGFELGCTSFWWILESLGIAVG
jgi:hypothetical protein